MDHSHAGRTRAGQLSAASFAAIGTSAVIDVGTAFALSISDARFQRPWAKLFSSDMHGMSFDALAKSLVGYEGPTLIAVQDDEGNRFGGVTSETWRENGVFYGSSQSALLSLGPSFAVRRSRGDGSAPGTGHFQVRT